MTSNTRTIDELCLSPFNVRTNAEDTSPNEAMEKSILAFGLIHALRVHPMRGSTKGKWGVHAGGRRYRAIKALIERGALPAEWPIDVVERHGSDADLLAESVAENSLRRDLHDYERYAGVARSHKRGDSIEQIAAICGQKEITIKMWIRLGNLAKPVFEALERGEIDKDQAKAYAATEDHALQLAAFEQLQPRHDWDKTPAKIRAFLRIGDVELSRLLRFVGSDSYVAAGGRLELDLFSDAHRIMDENKLRDLAHEQLAGVRDAVRVATQRAELRFVVEPPQASHGGPDRFLFVTPRVLSRDMLGDPERIELPDGDIVAHIRIAEGGEPEVTYWWESLKAKHGTKHARAEKVVNPMRAAVMADKSSALGGSVAYAAKPLVNAAIKQDAGLTEEGVEIFRSVRTFLLRGALLEDAADMTRAADAATDYLVWAQLRILLKGDMPHLIGLRGFTAGDRGPEGAREHIAAMEASRAWGHALYEVQQQSFFTGTDLGEAYLDYRASAPRLKRMAAAIVTGMALQRSLGADGYRIPLHDALAADLGLIDDDRIRAHWRPTAAMLDLLPKAERLAIAEPFVEAASFAPWSRAKSSDVTKFVLEVVTGKAATLRASMADAAARWVHPLLRFTAPPEPDAPAKEAANDATEMLEAAE